MRIFGWRISIFALSLSIHVSKEYAINTQTGHAELDNHESRGTGEVAITLHDCVESCKKYHCRPNLSPQPVRGVKRCISQAKPREKPRGERKEASGGIDAASGHRSKLEQMREQYLGAKREFESEIQNRRNSMMKLLYPLGTRQGNLSRTLLNKTDAKPMKCKPSPTPNPSRTRNILRCTGNPSGKDNSSDGKDRTVRDPLNSVSLESGEVPAPVSLYQDESKENRNVHIDSKEKKLNYFEKSDLINNPYNSLPYMHARTGSLKTEQDLEHTSPGGTITGRSTSGEELLNPLVSPASCLYGNKDKLNSESMMKKNDSELLDQTPTKTETSEKSKNLIEPLNVPEEDSVIISTTELVLKNLMDDHGKHYIRTPENSDVVSNPFLKSAEIYFERLTNSSSLVQKNVENNNISKLDDFSHKTYNSSILPEPLKIIDSPDCEIYDEVKSKVKNSETEEALERSHYMSHKSQQYEKIPFAERLIFNKEGHELINSTTHSPVIDNQHITQDHYFDHKYNKSRSNQPIKGKVQFSHLREKIKSMHGKNLPEVSIEKNGSDHRGVVINSEYITNQSHDSTKKIERCAVGNCRSDKNKLSLSNHSNDEISNDTIEDNKMITFNNSIRHETEESGKEYSNIWNHRLKLLQQFPSSTTTDELTNMKINSNDIKTKNQKNLLIEEAKHNNSEFASEERSKLQQYIIPTSVVDFPRTRHKHMVAKSGNNLKHQDSVTGTQKHAIQQQSAIANSNDDISGTRHSTINHDMIFKNVNCSENQTSVNKFSINGKHAQELRQQPANSKKVDNISSTRTINKNNDKVVINKNYSKQDEIFNEFLKKENHEHGTGQQHRTPTNADDILSTSTPLNHHFTMSEHENYLKHEQSHYENRMDGYQEHELLQKSPIATSEDEISSLTSTTNNKVTAEMNVNYLNQDDISSEYSKKENLERGTGQRHAIPTIVDDILSTSTPLNHHLTMSEHENYMKHDESNIENRMNGNEKQEILQKPPIATSEDEISSLMSTTKNKETAAMNVNYPKQGDISNQFIKKENIEHGTGQQHTTPTNADDILSTSTPLNQHFTMSEHENYFKHEQSHNENRMDGYQEHELLQKSPIATSEDEISSLMSITYNKDTASMNLNYLKQDDISNEFVKNENIEHSTGQQHTTPSNADDILSTSTPLNHHFTMFEHENYLKHEQSHNENRMDGYQEHELLQKSPIATSEDEISSLTSTTNNKVTAEMNVNYLNQDDISSEYSKKENLERGTGQQHTTPTNADDISSTSTPLNHHFTMSEHENYLKVEEGNIENRINRNQKHELLQKPPFATSEDEISSLTSITNNKDTASLNLNYPKQDDISSEFVKKENNEHGTGQQHTTPSNADDILSTSTILNHHFTMSEHENYLKLEEGNIENRINGNQKHELLQKPPFATSEDEISSLMSITNNKDTASMNLNYLKQDDISNEFVKKENIEHDTGQQHTTPSNADDILSTSTPLNHHFTMSKHENYLKYEQSHNENRMDGYQEHELLQISPITTREDEISSLMSITNNKDTASMNLNYLKQDDISNEFVKKENNEHGTGQQHTTPTSADHISSTSTPLNHHFTMSEIEYYSSSHKSPNENSMNWNRVNELLQQSLMPTSDEDIPSTTSSRNNNYTIARNESFLKHEVIHNEYLIKGNQEPAIVTNMDDIPIPRTSHNYSYMVAKFENYSNIKENPKEFLKNDSQYEELRQKSAITTRLDDISSTQFSPYTSGSVAMDSISNKFLKNNNHEHGSGQQQAISINADDISIVNTPHNIISSTKSTNNSKYTVAMNDKYSKRTEISNKYLTNENHENKLEHPVISTNMDDDSFKITLLNNNDMVVKYENYSEEEISPNENTINENHDHELLQVTPIATSGDISSARSSTDNNSMVGMNKNYSKHEESPNEYSMNRNYKHEQAQLFPVAIDVDDIATKFSTDNNNSDTVAKYENYSKLEDSGSKYLINGNDYLEIPRQNLVRSPYHFFSSDEINEKVKKIVTPKESGNEKLRLEQYEEDEVLKIPISTMNDPISRTRKSTEEINTKDQNYLISEEDGNEYHNTVQHKEKPLPIYLPSATYLNISNGRNLTSSYNLLTEKENIDFSFFSNVNPSRMEHEKQISQKYIASTVNGYNKNKTTSNKPDLQIVKAYKAKPQDNTKLFPHKILIKNANPTFILNSTSKHKTNVINESSSLDNENQSHLELKVSKEDSDLTSINNNEREKPNKVISIKSIDSINKNEVLKDRESINIRNDKEILNKTSTENSKRKESLICTSALCSKVTHSETLMNHDDNITNNGNSTYSEAISDNENKVLNRRISSTEMKEEKGKELNTPRSENENHGKPLYKVMNKTAFYAPKLELGSDITNGVLDEAFDLSREINVKNISYNRSKNLEETIFGLYKKNINDSQPSIAPEGNNKTNASTVRGLESIIGKINSFDPQGAVLKKREERKGSSGEFKCDCKKEYYLGPYLAPGGPPNAMLARPPYPLVTIIAAPYHVNSCENRTDQMALNWANSYKGGPIGQQALPSIQVYAPVNVLGTINGDFKKEEEEQLSTLTQDITDSDNQYLIDPIFQRFSRDSPSFHNYERFSEYDQAGEVSKVEEEVFRGFEDHVPAKITEMHQPPPRSSEENDVFLGEDERNDYTFIDGQYVRSSPKKNKMKRKNDARQQND